MNAGELKHKITIQELQRVPDGYGGYTETWNNVATAWAKIQPLKGSERYQAQQVASELSHKITLRYLSGVKPSMRIVYGLRVFNIIAVINVKKRNEVLELLCEEELT